MYTGQSPYGPAASAPQSAFLNAVIAPPSRVNRQLPSSVDAPLLRALNRDPAQRFGSCLEFVATLDAGLISQPERRPSGGSPKLLYAGIASLLAALLALFFVVASQEAPVVDTAAVTPTPPAAAVDAKKNPGPGKGGGRGLGHGGVGCGLLLALSRSGFFLASTAAAGGVGFTAAVLTTGGFLADHKNSANKAASRLAMPA